MDSGSGGVVLANMTTNPAYMTTGEVVTSFSGTEGDREKDYTYEVLPFEAAEEEQGGTTHGGQQDTSDGGQGVATGNVYANQWL